MYYVVIGVIPAIETPSDFRNTYSVYGMCGIDEDIDPLYWRIHDGNNDAEEFSYDVEVACIIGYLRQGDVLVLDNAAIHSGKDNKYLEDYIWERFGVWILFLPTRSPEWNPQELVWRVMVQGMQTIPLRSLREISTHRTVYAANASLNKITHKHVVGFFRHAQII